MMIKQTRYNFKLTTLKESYKKSEAGLIFVPLVFYPRNERSSYKRILWQKSLF